MDRLCFEKRKQTERMTAIPRRPVNREAIRTVYQQKEERDCRRVLEIVIRANEADEKGGAGRGTRYDAS